ncbi:hypothetical protein GALMADRAFT_204908 [Galerina marginata CBS 339.88]|uniref:Arrestin C-terminal-like domain-containing protein n=1 Tax=Galerina marginata (strain CBS 339.88) TaxID=685588 RepID=A0A067TQP2_GALM3|nr:hypothetical protein GALMADRAFT_204908 [Galerina marginata CBS 339.88]
MYGSIQKNSNANERERYVFYDSSAALSDVASNLEVLYDSEPDSEGFTRPKEGIHSLPFSFYISASIEHGTPKGHTTTLSGDSVRYIAMVSLRIKDPVSGKKSMAHFYRGCSIWPRLNPSVLLAPTSRPLQVTVSEGLVYLTASLHRLHWVAGQLCYVRFEVVNNSKKFLRSLFLELIQSTTTFKHKDQDDRVDVGVDVRSSTTKKQAAQSSLVVGEGGTRGHASAKDALSISRGKLLEISYAIHVTVSTSTFLSTDVHVSLPLDIINFLSIDPPPEQITEIGIKKVPCGAIPTSISTYEAIDDDASSELDGDYTSDEDETDSLGNLLVHEDTGKAVRQIILSATMDAENAPRFADLYFSSAEQNSDLVIGSESPCESSTEKILPAVPLSASNFISRVEEKNTKRIADLLGSRESAQAAEPFPGRDNIHTALHVSKGQQDQDVSIEGRFLNGLSGNRVAELSSFKSRAAKSYSSDECQPALPSLRSGTVQFDHTTLIAAGSRLKPIGSAVELSVETCLVDGNGVNNSQPTQDSISVASSQNGVGQFSAHREVSVGDIIDAYIRPSSPTVLQTQRLSPPFETADDQTPPFTQSLEECKLVKGNLRTTLAAPIRRLSVDLMLDAAPAAGSVRDKIRELEEFAAKAGADA